MSIHIIKTAVASRRPTMLKSALHPLNYCFCFSTCYNYNITFTHVVEKVLNNPVFFYLRGNFSFEVNTRGDNAVYQSSRWFENISAYNYATNITTLPRIWYNGLCYYHNSTYPNSSYFELKAQGIAFSPNSYYFGIFNGNDRYYYFPENSRFAYRTSERKFNNCVFWIDRANFDESNVNCFKLVANSIIYLNGCSYDGTLGANTQVIQKSFNVESMIANDINVR